MDLPISRICSQEQLETREFTDWMQRLGMDPTARQRKSWEFYFVSQTLQDCGLLKAGNKGLVFACGKEPLPALFASYGCRITATDLELQRARKKGWVSSQQHSSSLSDLNQLGLCDPAEFERLVSFRTVDMNHIPSDLTGYDFVWSCCSFEHLGSIRRGQQFIQNMLHCLKPGGIAIHTTEYNLSSNFWTKSRGNTVLFRKRDIEKMERQLRARGHSIEVDYEPGNMPLDKIVDMPPYSHNPHLRLRLYSYDATSVGLVIRKADRVAAAA